MARRSASPSSRLRMVDTESTVGLRHDSVRQQHKKPPERPLISSPASTFLTTGQFPVRYSGGYTMDQLQPAVADAFRLLRQDLYGYLDEAEFLATKVGEWSSEDAMA